METLSPRRHPAGDIAAHHDAVEPGPTPLVRALVGLALGAVAGAVILLATPPPGTVPE